MREFILPEVIDILERSTIIEHKLILPNEILERSLYEKVNDVLNRIGGKWKRQGKSKGVHLFPYDPMPLVQGVIESGELPPKNPTAFFPTPTPVVAKMIIWGEIASLNDERCRILEPSGGTGAIADAIRLLAPTAQLDVCEILPVNISLLKKKGFNVFEGDFLSHIPSYQYDAILMNPPFSVESDKLAWVTHIQHAWKLLKDDGILVAIVPSSLSYVSTKKVKEFRELVLTYGNWEALPDNSFKESGTGTSTIIMYMKKEDQTWKSKPYGEYSSWNVYITLLWLSNEHKFYEIQQNLYSKLQSGELRLDDDGKPVDKTLIEIKTLFSSIVEHANKRGEGIFLTESCWQSLISEFLSEYHEDCVDNTILTNVK